MKKILLIILLFTNCGASFLKVSYESKTVEDSEIRNYFTQIDKSYDFKSSLFIFKVNESDMFELTSSKNEVLLNGKLKNIIGSLSPLTFGEDLSRREDYLLKINGIEHYIKKENLLKYKYIKIEVSRDLKSYEVVYTNHMRGYR